MISTHVRRLRLGAELTRLRGGLASEKLARAAGLPRTTISRLENGRMRPDTDDVMRILECLKITGEQWTTVMTIAREASERGWWESGASRMGESQALYANLEAGADAIAEYQMALLPGLLQTASFTEARARVDEADWSASFDPIRAVEARAGRQRMLHRPGGPAYEVVIDEMAIRRSTAVDDIRHEQLVHIRQLAQHDPKITVRVLPIDCRIEGRTVPRSGFSIYHYPDPDDPVVVAVDSVTADLVLTEAVPVAHYQKLYGRLRDAALTPVGSIQFLAEMAENIVNLTGKAA
jgi:DNA-binding XRE family transcriptional regulator